MKPRKTWLQHRNSITGHYCSAAYAAAHPDTTQSIAREQEPPGPDNQMPTNEGNEDNG
jgi:hypothetical protein